jgi:hypothetical protein
MFYYLISNGSETKVSKSKNIRDKSYFKSNNHPSKLSLWVDANFDKITTMIVSKQTYDSVKSA